MTKEKNITIFYLLIFFGYFLLSQFCLKQLGSTYTYIINPLFFLIMAVILKSTILSPYKTEKFSKAIRQLIIITVLSYSVVFLFSGVFLTYGNNPYSTTFKGLMLNLYSIGSVIVFREYIRYKLINNVYKKDRRLIFTLIVITFTMQDFDIAALFESLNIYYAFKTIFSVIIPSIARNCLFTYIDLYASYKNAIVYDLTLWLLKWIPPILSNTPWVFNAIIDTVFPLILFIYCMYEIGSKDKLSVYKISSPIKPKGLIPLSICLVLIIWFALGIFPIKPLGIASASMEPAINIGDLVVIVKCNSNDVKEQDVIEYKRNGYSVVHRVIEKYQEDGHTFFITKGDNNGGNDEDPVSEDKLQGKAIAKIPYLAYPAVWIERLSGRQNYVDVGQGD